jgi:hypothetical protein
MNLRQLDSSDAAEFSALRLAALRECPTVFSSSYEEECDIPLARRAERMAPDRDNAIFGAFDGSRTWRAPSRSTGVDSRGRARLRR